MADDGSPLDEPSPRPRPRLPQPAPPGSSGFDHLQSDPAPKQARAPRRGTARTRSSSSSAAAGEDASPATPSSHRDRPESASAESGDFTLASPMERIPGVRRRQARALARLGIHTVADLIKHLPARYEYELDERPIATLEPETLATAVGTVGDTRMAGRRMYRNSSRFEANLIDASGRLLLTWFNGAYLQRKIHPGMVIRVQGKVKQYGGYLQMVNPRWQPVDPAEMSDGSGPGHPPAPENDVDTDAGGDRSIVGHAGTSDETSAATEAPETELPGRLHDSATEDLPEHAPTADGRYRPVYPATEDLTNLQINAIVDAVLERALPLIEDHLDPASRKRRSLPPLAEAYRMIHRPATKREIQRARRRLKYDEWLLLQTGIAMRRYQLRQLSAAWPLRWNEAIHQHILARFPFTLTADQARVIDEIRADLVTPTPMNRLLQGDVGSGKTAVAVYAMLLAVASECQAALMAPTELLAEQHFGSISALLEGSNVRIELVTGTLKPRERRAVQARVAAGDIDIIIGTHALLSGWLRFHRLALAVIDEQHRFGVHQRANLRAAHQRTAPAGDASDSVREDAKDNRADSAPLLQTELAFDAADDGNAGDDPAASGSDAMAHRPRFAATLGAGPAFLPAPDADDDAAKEDGNTADRENRMPHMLVMTATPIPRTLSLTLFGDLDVSTIRERPPGRQPVATRVVSPEIAQAKVYPYVAERIAGGEQAYIVVPAIEENPDANLIGVDELKSRLEAGPLRDLRLAAVHGRLNRDTREAIMYRFRRGEIDALIATTVIEVGVDVPNASIMVIENADRFGLSQLHQLRGRVGRGNRRSLCVFVATPTTDDARDRLEAIAGTDDGFEIAERDLEIRGMGEIFGSRQSGEAPFRIAQLPDDLPLLKIARADADRLIADDPFLAHPDRRLFRARLMKAYGEAFGIGDVG